jgi:saccharopine dehydrogenase-like NADP-dependent oxidoreductase
MDTWDDGPLSGMSNATSMRRVLILGGYGVFGSRVAERLGREPDIELVVAGRSATRAEAAAAQLERSSGHQVRHAVMDATTATAESLRATGATVIVNASGPFQTQDYTLPRAAISAGVHYVDLADSSAFVTGIDALDATARAARVLVVSGASSVPGLSSAVLDRYAPCFATLESVSHGITPGNSFDPGEATTASILGAVGTAFQMRSDGREQTVHGWQGLHRHSFPGIGRRWMGHCDVPDLTLFAKRYPGLRTIRFAAGVEVGMFHLGLYALSWLVRVGLLRRPESLAAPLLALKRQLSFLGSDQGGMFMSLQGRDASGRPKRIDWHLEARQGHGPYIPAIASVILARKLARGQLDLRGATACVGLVSLSELLAEVADLDIRATDTSTPLYARVLGGAYAQLPGRVRALHHVTEPSRWVGCAGIERGAGQIVRILGAIAGLPPAGRAVPLSVTFSPVDGDEIWSRDFGGHVFRSRQGEAGPQVWERVGPSRFLFRPLVDADGLHLELADFRILGVPVPRAVWPSISTREWDADGRYHFAVEARIPLIGLLVRYTGWLVPADETTPASTL